MIGWLKPNCTEQLNLSELGSFFSVDLGEMEDAIWLWSHDELLRRRIKNKTKWN